MKITETEIYEMEKGLIKKYKKLLGHVKPRKIKFVRNCGYAGCAAKQLEINKDWLKTATKENLIEVLKHELAHYAADSPFAAHNGRFMDLCEKLGCSPGDLSYSFGKAIDEYGLLGMVTKEDTSDGEIFVTFKKKPNWETFRGDILYRYDNTGWLFKCLRKGRGKSRKEVAKDMGISDYALKKLEARRNWEKTDKEFDTLCKYNRLDYETLKEEIFNGIIPWDDNFQEKLFKTIVRKKKGGDES